MAAASQFLASQNLFVWDHCLSIAQRPHNQLQNGKLSSLNQRLFVFLAFLKLFPSSYEHVIDICAVCAFLKYIVHKRHVALNSWQNIHVFTVWSTYIIQQHTLRIKEKQTNKHNSRYCVLFSADCQSQRSRNSLLFFSSRPPPWVQPEPILVILWGQNDDIFGRSWSTTCIYVRCACADLNHKLGISCWHILACCVSTCVYPCIISSKSMRV